MSTVTILASAFVISVAALMAFIWSQRRGLLDVNPAASRVIFEVGEEGRAEDPAVGGRSASALQQVVDTRARSAGLAVAQDDAQQQRTLAWRAEADASTAPVVFFFFCCAFTWLLVASAAGLTASIKLHEPEFLGSQAWLTFGRVRTMHLNAVAYGWAPMAGLGVALFVLPRLLGTPLMGARFAMLGGALWNAALIAGLGSIAAGLSDGLEWLEIPWQIDILFVVGGALIGLPLVMTLLNRRVQHLYVSIWYMGCALFWFPVLFLVANIPGLHGGIEQATMNWWFGHNVLGLFYTPLALASIYYFLPKVIGRPVQSYNLSLLGFWGLAFFYGQVGGHHLIGGPVPGWLVTLSIVQSMMMALPVLAFTANQYFTLKGHMGAMRHSPTLRFICVGGLLYTASSLQGSAEALRSINVVTHFTHFTVAHAHLGLYGFVTMVLFGSMYFIVPRITRREWPYPSWISIHFWLVSIGFSIYFIGLSIGGWLQGMAMLDASQPFIESMRITLPYLKARTVGGVLMVLGHLVFATHFVCVILGLGPNRSQPALFSRRLLGARHA